MKGEEIFCENHNKDNSSKYKLFLNAGLRTIPNVYESING